MSLFELLLIFAFNSKTPCQFDSFQFLNSIQLVQCFCIGLCLRLAVSRGVARDRRRRLFVSTKPQMSPFQTSSRNFRPRYVFILSSGHHQHAQPVLGRPGSLLLQPYDTEKGAGTMSPHTVLRAIGPEPWAVAYPEPCRRPTDGRYGDNPNRAQHYFQYQVLIKPSPDGIQETGVWRRWASRPLTTTSVSSKTTGSPQPSAPGVWAGKCGSTVWR